MWEDATIRQQLIVSMGKAWRVAQDLAA